MKKYVKKQIFYIILLLYTVFTTYGQSRVAVIPFESKNTSSIEAEAVTAVFETAFDWRQLKIPI